jgi:hypothetical protein
MLCIKTCTRRVGDVQLQVAATCEKSTSIFDLKFGCLEAEYRTNIYVIVLVELE